MARTYVDTDRPHSEFLLSLTDVLRLRGAEVLAAPVDGAAVLDITSDETGQRVLSVSARNIPREYEVYYAVTFSLRVGTETLDRQRVARRDARLHLRRDAKCSRRPPRKQILREALAEDLARRVMQRIQALGATAAAAAALDLTPCPLRSRFTPPPSSRSPTSIDARSRSCSPTTARGSSSSRRTSRFRARTGATREAGLIGDAVYARADTPAHSLLHELCHYVCMDDARRAALATDAGGNDDEESAVCYLQVLLARALARLRRERCLHDMDAWGYSFREGSARAWFRGDGRSRARLAARARAHRHEATADREVTLILRAIDYETVTSASRCAALFERVSRRLYSRLKLITRAGA